MWATVIQGAVTRVTDFGAFVELLPGLDGLVHLTEMSWSKKVRKASDMVKPGEMVDVVVLGVNIRGAPDFAGVEAGAGRPLGGR